MSPTPPPPAVPFRGRAKWRAVGGELVLFAAAAAFAAVVAATVPPDVVPVRVLVWYTAGGALTTLALAVAIAATDQLPTVVEDTLDGVPAVKVPTWPGQWWHDVALDVALAVLGGVFVVLGLRAGGEWALWSVVPGLVAAWFLVRAGRALAGHRRNPALWVTASEIVHDGRLGRRRWPRTELRRVRRSYVGEQVLVQLEDRDVVLDTRWVGHEADALAAYLQDLLGTDREGYPRRGRDG